MQLSSFNCYIRSITVTVAILVTYGSALPPPTHDVCLWAKLHCQVREDVEIRPRASAPSPLQGPLVPGGRHHRLVEFSSLGLASAHRDDVFARDIRDPDLWQGRGGGCLHRARVREPPAACSRSSGQSRGLFGTFLAAKQLKRPSKRPSKTIFWHHFRPMFMHFGPLRGGVCTPCSR